MNEVCLAIDVSHLDQDQRGIGFFVRQFLDQLVKTDHNFTIHLVTERGLSEKSWPFPVVRPKQVDRKWLTWFPFNHPTFKPPGAYVVTIHDLAPFVFPKGESKLRQRFRKGARRAKTIFVDSRFIAVEVEKFLRVGDSKITHIPLGFDSAWPNGEAFRPPRPYLLAIGPAEPRKNFVRLLEAFHELKERKFPHKLALVGDLSPWRKTFGPFDFETDNPLPRLARKKKLSNDVIFPGRVSRAELKNWYERASLVVVPSIYEGFGYPILEAFSCRVPVACSHASSLPEVAGNAAFYFNPTDPEDMATVIEHALTSPASAAKKIKLAEAQLSKFTWDRCVRKYLEAFEAVVRAS